MHPTRWTTSNAHRGGRNIHKAIQNVIKDVCVMVTVRNGVAQHMRRSPMREFPMVLAVDARLPCPCGVAMQPVIR